VVGGQGAAIVDGVTQGTTMNGSAASKTDGHFQDYTVTPGSRIIAVKCTTGSTNFMLTGVQFFNQDETKGVHVWDGAHSGGNSTHWLQSSFDPMWAGFVPALKPNLIIIALGTNDWDSITAAAYLANIDSMLAKIATAMGSSPYSVLLVQGYRPGRAARDGVQVWADMMAGLRARAVGNVASVSLEPPWPSLLPDGSTNGGLMFESTNPVHPQFAGHTLYAQVLADAVRPPPVFEELATGEASLSGNPRCYLGDTQRAGL
jgi:lysophospholipase L1-like esterase